jgi:hypothetical protein
MMDRDCPARPRSQFHGWAGLPGSGRAGLDSATDGKTRTLQHRPFDAALPSPPRGRSLPIKQGNAPPVSMDGGRGGILLRLHEEDGVAGPGRAGPDNARAGNSGPPLARRRFATGLRVESATPPPLPLPSTPMPTPPAGPAAGPFSCTLPPDGAPPAHGAPPPRAPGSGGPGEAALAAAATAGAAAGAAWSKI